MNSPTDKHGDLIFDVGLHKGEDTEFYLKKGFRVVAFEADPDLASHCRKRFSADIERERLAIVEGAIIDHIDCTNAPTSVNFYKNLDHSVWGTTIPNWADRNERLGSRTQQIEVATVDITDAIRRYGMPYYMKIDIEGCDEVCLRALGSLDGRPDFISIESNKTSYDHLAREIELLSNLGYRSFAAVQQGSIERQRLPSTPREGLAIKHEFPKGSSGMFGREVSDRWMSRDEILNRYRRIFLFYRVFGDDSWFARSPLGRKLLRYFEKALKRRIPGWYDTHARLDGPSDFDGRLIPQAKRFSP